MQVEVIGAPEALYACPGRPPADFTLHLEGLPDWVDESPRELIQRSPPGRGEPPPRATFRFLSQPYFLFCVKERHVDFRFLLLTDGREAWADWSRAESFSNLAIYIVGLMMGYTLRFQGVTTLHASVVEIDGRAVLAMGRSFAGKSTCAAAFAKLGYRVLSDDLAPLRARESGFFVAPGYPRICLRPPSVELLFGDEDALPLITPTWIKRYLSLSGAGFDFCPDSLPLGAVYWISGRVDNPAAPWIEEVSATSALMGLIANTYGGKFPDPAMSGRDVAFYSTVVETVPVRKVVARADRGTVLQQCQLIAADFRSIRR